MAAVPAPLWLVRCAPGFGCACALGGRNFINLQLLYPPILGATSSVSRVNEASGVLLLAVSEVSAGRHRSRNNRQQLMLPSLQVRQLVVKHPSQHCVLKLCSRHATAVMILCFQQRPIETEADAAKPAGASAGSQTPLKILCLGTFFKAWHISHDPGLFQQWSIETVQRPHGGMIANPHCTFVLGCGLLVNRCIVLI